MCCKFSFWVTANRLSFDSLNPCFLFFLLCYQTIPCDPVHFIFYVAMRHLNNRFKKSFDLKLVSVTTTASVCKPTTRATWALLFWPTLPTSSVCKPTTFAVTERGLWFENLMMKAKIDGESKGGEFTEVCIKYLFEPFFLKYALRSRSIPTFARSRFVEFCFQKNWTAS